MNKVALMAGIFATALLASGCSSVQRTIEPERIFAEPREATTISPIYIKSDQTVDCSRVNLVNGDRSLPSQIEQFAQAMHCAYDPPPGQEAAWLQRFVEKGVSLSMHSCIVFFDSLEKRRVDTAYAQTNMNLAGTALTAILVGAGHNARSAFNVATSLALGNAWFENYKANYVLTPQLGKLHRKVKEMQDDRAARMRPKAKDRKYASFDEAKWELQEFDDMCSHKAIVMLLEAAVEAAKVDFEDVKVSDKELAQLEDYKKALYGLAHPGAPGGFAPKELEALYVIGSADTEKQRALAAEALLAVDPNLQPYIANLQLDKNIPSAVSAYLQQIASISRFSQSQVVVELRSIVEKYAEAKKKKETDAKKAMANRLGGKPNNLSSPPVVPQLKALEAFQHEIGRLKAEYTSVVPSPGGMTGAGDAVSFRYRVR